MWWREDDGDGNDNDDDGDDDDGDGDSDDDGDSDGDGDGDDDGDSDDDGDGDDDHENAWWWIVDSNWELTLSYTGGHKVPALISKIRIFKTNTATATKFGDFS